MGSMLGDEAETCGVASRDNSLPRGRAQTPKEPAGNTAG